MSKSRTAMGVVETIISNELLAWYGLGGVGGFGTVRTTLAAWHAQCPPYGWPPSLNQPPLTSSPK